MQNYIYYLLLLLFCSFFIACEESIDLELPEYENDIVLYGVLIAGEQPQILLTESTGYFEPLNNRDRLIVIEDATVILSDGTQTYNLSYDPLMTSHSYWVNNFNEYTSDFLGGYTIEDIIIEEGKTYTIEVKHKERTLTGETTIPKKANLNNATHEIEVFNDPFSPGLICWRDKLEVNFDDPDEENFYKIYWEFEQWNYDFCDPVIIDNEEVEVDSCRSTANNVKIPIFEDTEFNNTNYSYQINTFAEGCGNFMPDTSAMNESSRFTIHKFVLQTVSKELFEFNNSLNMQQQSAANPFQEPTTIKSTIEGGIGIFAAKSAPSDTIVLRVNEIL